MLLAWQAFLFDYDKMKSQFSALIKQAGGPRHCIFDLTGAAKGPSIDIFAMCLAMGITSVFLFELADPFDKDNPDNSLYHNLSDSGYRYTCLSSTAPVQASQSLLLRKAPMLWATVFASSIAIIVTVTLGLVAGPNSTPFQWLNIIASVVGLLAPMFALVQSRRG